MIWEDAINHKSLIRIDTLLDSLNKHGNLALGDVICTTSRKIAIEVDPH